MADSTPRTSVCHHISDNATATFGVQVLRAARASHRISCSEGRNPFARSCSSAQASAHSIDAHRASIARSAST
jgi:hypothetical protein